MKNKTEISKQRASYSLNDLLHGGVKQLALKVWQQIRFRALALARPLTTLRRHRAISDKTIIVYTMGKVGSSSIYYSLIKSFPFRRIFHNHFLSNEWLSKRLPGSNFARNIRLAKPALQHIEEHDRQVYYICMMRDPIARDLSNVIQNYLANQIDIHNTPMAAVIQQIEQSGHMFYEDWFATDFFGHIGRHITTFPFDPVRGYSIHRIDNRRHLLILKVEAMDRVFEKALSEFIGVDVDPQFRFNESSEKSEAIFYETLKKSYRLSQEKLVQIYGTEIVRHFYSEAEIKALMAKWASV